MEEKKCEGCKQEKVIEVTDGAGEKMDWCEACGLYQTITD